MYAIFEAKGKQWRAERGATIKLPSLDAEPGEQVTFDEVLLAQDGAEVMVGRPALEGASIVAEVTEHGKGDKIVVFKRKKRKGYRRKQGHRQPYTEVKIVDIELDGVTVAPAEEAEPEPEEAPAEPEAAEVEEAAEEEPPEAEAIDVTDAAADLAEDYGIDLTELEGTGKDGRILKSDVQEAVDALEAVIPEEIDITDAALELAEDYGIDLTAVEGTGKDGRILKSDVQDAIDEQRRD